MNMRRIGLGFVLMATMAVATFSPIMFSVLATTLRAEFSLDRWQIGFLVAAVMTTGAVLSPRAGALADRVLPRHSTAATLAVPAVMFLAMSVAPGYWWLAAAGLLGGVAQALSNPATNRLIMSQAEVGRRGFLTGIKQAGVQAGNFLGGILLPIGAASLLGWRGTIALIPVISLTGLAVLGLLTRGRPAAEVHREPPSEGRAAPVVLRLAVFAAVMGLATGGLTTYLPSFAQESFGWSAAAGGALVSVFAAVGLATRLTAGMVSELWLGHHRTLVTMALLTAAAGSLLAVSPTGGWLWPVAVLVGLGPMAWNVVANLAVMELSPVGGAGRGSGVMMAGFLGGFAAGAPIFGWSVDLSTTYRPGWLAVAVLGLVAAWVGRKIRAEEPVPV